MTEEKIISRYLEEAPVDLEGMAEALDLEVYYDPNLPSNISGSIKKKGNRYLISINAKHPAVRQRFPLAHEIGHYLLHRDRIGDGIDDNELYRSGLPDIIESEANRMAARLIMPADLVRRLYHSGLRSIVGLKGAFQVSEEAMRIRLEQLDLSP